MSRSKSHNNGDVAIFIALPIIGLIAGLIGLTLSVRTVQLHRAQRDQINALEKRVQALTRELEEKQEDKR